MAKKRTWRSFIGAISVILTLIHTPAFAKSVLKVGNLGEPASLDPHYVSGTWENRIVGNMFLGLTTEDQKGNPIPGAAESWTVSNDGLVYTFKIRNHLWSDGKPVTAQDFEFALKRIIKPETAAEYASLLYIIKGAEAINTGKAKADTLAVKAKDDKTLEITLTGPAPYFLAQLTHYTAYPLPKHVVEAEGKSWIKKNMVVNGPFKLKEWTPSDRVVLVKNEKFYDAGNVKLDEVVLYPQEDMAAITKRFRAGEIDWATSFPSNQISFLKNNLPNQTFIAPYLGVYYYPINTAKAPFNNLDIRRALSMAIDREVIVEKILKTGEIPAYSMVPPGTPNYGKSSEADFKSLSKKERVEQAKKLLAKAGYGPSNPLTFQLRYNTNENHKRIAIAISAMWKKIGVKAELFNSEVKVHYADLKQGDFDIARAGWIADYPDPQAFLYLLETRTGPNNYGRYSNPEFDKLMVEAGNTPDLEKRAGLMAKAEAMAMADQPIMPIYFNVSKNLVAKHVKGWEPTTNDVHRLRWISIQK